MRPSCKKVCYICTTDCESYLRRQALLCGGDDFRTYSVLEGYTLPWQKVKNFVLLKFPLWKWGKFGPQDQLRNLTGSLQIHRFSRVPFRPCACEGWKLWHCSENATAVFISYTLTMADFYRRVEPKAPRRKGYSSRPTLRTLSIPFQMFLVSTEYSRAWFWHISIYKH